MALLSVAHEEGAVVLAVTFDLQNYESPYVAGEEQWLRYVISISMNGKVLAKRSGTILEGVAGSLAKELLAITQSSADAEFEYEPLEPDFILKASRDQYDGIVLSWSLDVDAAASGGIYSGNMVGIRMLCPPDRLVAFAEEVLAEERRICGTIPEQPSRG